MFSSIFIKTITFFKIYRPVDILIFGSLYIYRRIFYQSLRHSYSQYQEDLIIDRILSKKHITYVDIGANHPTKFNNTYRFYLKGGRGINIEPNRNLIKLFTIQRPKDTNLQMGISNSNRTALFYQLYPHVNSTFSHQHYLSCLQQNCILESSYPVTLKTLKSILKKHFSPSKKFSLDLLCIDTEGWDLNVLKSNDWNQFRPKVICVETQSTSALHRFLTQKGYFLYQKTPLNSIYLQTAYGRP